jgi:hypothetical protein
MTLSRHTQPPQARSSARGTAAGKGRVVHRRSLSGDWLVAGAIAAFVLSSSVAAAQTPAADTESTAAFRLLIVGHLAPEFSQRVAEYHELRLRLEERLPPQLVTDDAGTIRSGELALARLVRIARGRAHEGDIFTAASAIEFRHVLHVVMTPDTWAVIMDDNPGEFSNRINGAYPKSRSLSTMPYAVLTQLPSLPDGIEYRFVGRHLILHDTRANVILDRIRYAIECRGCDD